MAVVVKDLKYTYNPGSPFESVAIDGVSLHIEKGEFFGIIGHTGSGKSTFVQHLNGLVKATSGQVTVAGIEVWKEKSQLKELRSKCGMVFQYPEYQLFGETCFEDVEFGLKNFFGLKTDKNPKGMTKDEMAEKVKEAMELVGLNFEKYAARSPFQLSGGQKRRLAIAGIIVTRPEILILDEPTAGLDPKGKGDILKLIRSLHQSCSPTIIMISHDMDEIAENCDRVCVLAKGKVAFIDETAKLFERDEELKALNLDVPLVSKIMKVMKAKGITVPFNHNLKEFSKLLAEKICQFQGGEKK